MTVSRTLEVLMNNRRCHRMRNLKAGALLLQRNCLRPRTLLAPRHHTSLRAHEAFHCKKTCDRRDRQKQKSKAGSAQEPGILVATAIARGTLRVATIHTRSKQQPSFQNAHGIRRGGTVYSFLNSGTVEF